MPLNPWTIITPDVNEAGGPRGKLTNIVTSAPNAQLVMLLSQAACDCWVLGPGIAV